MDKGKELHREERKMRRLRLLVDFTTALLGQADLTREQALELVGATRRRVLAMFPGKEQTFDLIYASRFRRIIEERFGCH